MNWISHLNRYSFGAMQSKMPRFNIFPLFFCMRFLSFAFVKLYSLDVYCLGILLKTLCKEISLHFIIASATEMSSCTLYFVGIRFFLFASLFYLTFKHNGRIFFVAFVWTIYRFICIFNTILHLPRNQDIAAISACDYVMFAQNIYLVERNYHARHLNAVQVH